MTELEYWVDPDSASRIVGSYYSAVEPDGTPADLVVVRAIVPVGDHVETLTAGVAVACAEFGAIPAGWSSPTESFDGLAFLGAYRRATDAELTALRKAQETASKKATAADEKSDRPTPWRRG